LPIATNSNENYWWTPLLTLDKFCVARFCWNILEKYLSYAFFGMHIVCFKIKYYISMCREFNIQYNNNIKIGGHRDRLHRKRDHVDAPSQSSHH